MKQIADLKVRKLSVNEKACLASNKIKLKNSANSTFETQMTMFVPKAKSDKPMPKIALTISVGHDQIRLVADKSSDLMDYFAEIYAMISEKEKLYDIVVEKERAAWTESVNEKSKEATNRMAKNRSNVIQMPKKAI